MNNRDLTVKEACNYLKLSYTELIILVRNNVIPSYKIGNNYMLREEDLNKWQYNKNNKINPNEYANAEAIH